MLLERSSPDNDYNVCSFEDKVTIVQQAGAAAAVVFDYQSEGPITMVYGHPEGVDIPAVFISHEAGMALLDAMVDQHAKPLTLLAPPPSSPGPGQTAAARFELVSFTTGYLLLLLCALPVALHNAIALLKRRRALEAILRVVSFDPELKATLEAREELAEHLPLPMPADNPAGIHPTQGRQGRCLRLHRFLGLALTVYVAQMMLLWAFAPPPGQQQEQEEEMGNTSPGAAALFGVNEVINALLTAACLLLLHRCWVALARCVCGTHEDEENGDGDEGGEETDQECQQEAPTTIKSRAAQLPDAQVTQEAKVSVASLVEPLIVAACDTTGVPAQYNVVVATRKI